MPGLAQRNEQYSNASFGFWSKQNDVVSYNQLQKFWSELSMQARQKLLRIDKQTLFERARKNIYCSRCNGLLLEGFLQIVMYGKSLQQEGVAGNLHYNRSGASKKGTGGGLNLTNGTQDEIQDPSVHPWGGLTTTRNGSLTLLDCYLCPKSFKGLQNVFDSARARERERELLYPDACGGGGRGWISQGIASYGRGHGTRETCALHTARLSCDTLVDFWSALGEETRQSLLRMKEEDFIERLMFDSKRFCRDCRRNVIHEFKELKELKRMRREPRCTSWFCVADTAFLYEVSHDTVKADWRQTFADTIGTYHHFEWAVGTGEGKSDIREFENVGMNGSVRVRGLDLDGLSSCYITLRAWKLDGRCSELSLEMVMSQSQEVKNIRRFFEHAEEVEEEEDDDSMDKDGNEIDGECFRPQKHAKSPELAREFLLDAATVEKAFREGTARQNAHSIFVCLAIKLLEERVHVACKEIITLEKQDVSSPNSKVEENVSINCRDSVCETNDIIVSTLGYPDDQGEQFLDGHLASSLQNHSFDSPDEEGTKVKDGNGSFPTEQSKFSRQRLKFRKDGQFDTSLTWSNRRRFPVVSESAPINRSEARYKSENFEAPSRSINGPNKQLRINSAKSNGRNCDVKYPEKFQCPNSRSDRYDIYSCSCGQHKEYRAKIEPYVSVTGVGQEPKAVSKSKSALDMSKQVYRESAPINRSEARYKSENFEAPSRSINGPNKQLRINSAKSNGRNCDVKYPEKFQCPNSRSDRYDIYSCSCGQHKEYRAKIEPYVSVTGVGQEAKAVSKSKSALDMSKQVYRGNKYNQQEYMHEDCGRLKNKIIAGNNPSGQDSFNSNKVWEPTEVQRNYPRTNSDTDITLRSSTYNKGAGLDNDFVKSSGETCTSEASVNLGEISHDHSKVNTSSTSLATNENCDVEAQDKCSSLNAASEDVEEIAIPALQIMETIESSSSDSEEASQRSDGRDTSSCVQNGFSECQVKGIDKKEDVNGGIALESEALFGHSPDGRDSSVCIQDGFSECQVKGIEKKQDVNGGVALVYQALFGHSPDSRGNKVSGNPLTTVAISDNEKSTAVMSSQHQGTFTSVHNQPIQFPVYQAPSTMGYYHQNPVSWSATPANGLMPFPSNPYFYTGPLGYDVNGNSRLCMPYGTLQHFATPLFNPGPVPVYQPVSKANGLYAEDQLQIPKLVTRKEDDFTEVNSEMFAPGRLHTTEQAANGEGGQNDVSTKPHTDDTSFSLFHFGGPVALSTACKSNPAPLKEEIAGEFSSQFSAYHVENDHACNKKETTIEEYSLFAASNGIRFSFF
ncbi:hypothetical protein GOBAR_AA23691 [Gossypium barbadense]|uniref:Uncharacterized protein n=1 Tax=Gossypium barbadense TaxID=3634 RepID=A0A2P5X0W9_GOSBA|nr:hypothetical protein GOBAR_AA23691 [Gossypium barbadense]